MGGWAVSQKPKFIPAIYIKGWEIMHAYLIFFFDPNSFLKSDVSDDDERFLSLLRGRITETELLEH